MPTSSDDRRMNLTVHGELYSILLKLRAKLEEEQGRPVSMIAVVNTAINRLAKEKLAV